MRLVLIALIAGCTSSSPPEPRSAGHSSARRAAV